MTKVYGQMFGTLYKIKKDTRIEIDHDEVMKDDDKNKRPETESAWWFINEQLKKHIDAQFDTLPQKYHTQVEFGGDGGDGYVMYTFETEKTFDFAIPVFRTTLQGKTYEIEFQDYPEWEDESDSDDE